MGAPFVLAAGAGGAGGAGGADAADAADAVAGAARGGPSLSPTLTPVATSDAAVDAPMPLFTKVPMTPELCLMSPMEMPLLSTGELLHRSDSSLSDLRLAP